MRRLFGGLIFLLVVQVAGADTQPGEWQSLFDGRTLDGWQRINGQPVHDGWVVEDGCIHRKSESGDIVTAESFEDFELELEWKISPGGNSGIKYGFKKGLGPEYQVLDDDKHPNGRNPKTRAASMYALFPCNDRKQLRPVGEFNKARIVVQGTHIEHWLNGEKVLEADTASPEWAAAKARSKFRKASGYGEGAGRILLQDHGDLVWYRNVRIRRLPARTTPPNVLMILADDQGWGDLGVTGNTNLRTPNIDSLAHAGARFDRFYVCAVCSPTRAEMLTGRYHTRLGVTGTSRGDERFSADEKTIGDIFKAAGYSTGAFGKWHSGTQWPYHPNARGFDEFYGFCSGHWGHYFSPSLEHNGRLVRGNGYVTDDFTDRAIEFIKQNRDLPFFCYVPYNTPHSPMQVPDPYWDKLEKAELEMRHRQPDKENLQHTRAALAMCENIDWNVGRLLETLDELGLAQDTIVIYFSDNGPNGWRWNGGMKGRKGSVDEGGVRSPCFWRWPGIIKPGTVVPQIAGAIDLLPTLADLCGASLTDGKLVDGVSLRPLLCGNESPWPERLYFNAWGGRVSVRSQRYRLDSKDRLFDMEADPGQNADVSKRHPQEADRLLKARAEWRETAVVKVDKRPFTVGHAGSRSTYLPARDATATGTIRRSSRHPNCSFFTNWTREDDTIEWPIEVLMAGTYEAAIRYTCARENAGAVMELSFGDSSARFRVDEAFDPPLVGAAEDRAPRTESLVKDFKSLPIGTMGLPAGRGVLRLAAIEIPGAAAIDVRDIILTRMTPAR